MDEKLTNAPGTTSVAWLSEFTVPRPMFLLGCCLLVGWTSCKPKDRNASLVARETFAELRVVKGQVTITEAGKRPREPYPRERLADGATLKLEADSLAFLRDDRGATWLLAGPVQAKTSKHAFELVSGKAFVDTQSGPSVTLHTPSGMVEVSEGRSSITSRGDGTVEAYALRGAVRQGALRANAGEMLTLAAGRPAAIQKISTWDDWTSGLATADPEAQPAPYGIGTVGARSAGEQGKPRFSLVIQRLEVRVNIDHDFAQTEVDETFVNPSPNEVEGVFSFRVPENAILHRFGVDRDGLLVWGRTQEKRSAAAQYQANVYSGSTEDPALLEWVQRGVYQARLYPIGGGTSRRVVTRYGEWLARSGARGERRLYVYPMAATGAEGTLPRIEELTIRVDWSKANASTVRAPLGSVVRGKQLIVKAFDVLPKADWAVELFDAGQSELLAYRARHALGDEDAPVGAEAGFARKTSQEEADYVLVPITPTKIEQQEPGLDLAIVLDSSAANEASAMAVGRSLVQALLNALGPTDRAALFTGDTTLRPVLADSQALTTLDETRKKKWLAELANAPLGGATDIGTMLAEAAERLDPKRRSAVVYVGDGRPSVGELLPKALHERLNRLPPTARIFAAGIGSQVNRTLLESLVRGAPLEVVQNGYEAAQAALRLLEAATTPSLQNVSLKLAGVDRLMPRSVPVVAAGEPALVVGRIAGGLLGNQIQVNGPLGNRNLPVRIVSLEDDGDLRRRWGEGRLDELVEQHAGRLAVVDLARRYGLVSPWTSLYVATRKEAEAGANQEIARSELTPEQEREQRQARQARWRPWGLLGGALYARSAPSEEVVMAQQAVVAAKKSDSRADDNADNKEGGTGTRAKGEEGSMKSRAAALREAQEYGMIGLLNRDGQDGDQRGGDQRGGDKEVSKRYSVQASGAAAKPMKAGRGAPAAPAAAPLPAEPQAAVPASEAAASSDGQPAPAGAPVTSNPAMGEGIGLGNIGTLGNLGVAGKLTSGAGTGTGQGFGSGHGRLGGGHRARPPKIQMGGELVVERPSPSAASDQPKPAKSDEKSVESPPAPLAQLSHQLAPCSAGSDLPLNERRKLWRERLSGCSTTACVRPVYDTAIRDCEAPGWYERQLLLYAMVDQLPTVTERVRLFRSYTRSPAAADVVYRAILTRINDAKALHELHEALGIKSATPELLAGLLRRADNPAQRVKFLQELVRQWPGDFELMLRLFEAYEDAQDFSGARALARRLRRRPDATSHVRTWIGEFYWRCSERETDPDKSRDLEEARRAFGEIVEFAPEDPAARRRLGDLLRAHGWYDEALRQYETLRDLLPDDPTVHLLIAAAAQGVGKTEEALRWSEKAAATGAPDGQSDLERAARAVGSAFLAWAREDAQKAGRASDAERLLLRGRKLASDVPGNEGRIRFILTWEHPELRPTLYAITNSGPVLAQQMSQLGVAEQLAAKEEPRVELRLDPEEVERVARLGAEVVLTAIVGDGTPEQQATRMRLRFGDRLHPKSTIRVAYANGALEEEAR